MMERLLQAKNTLETEGTKPKIQTEKNKLETGIWKLRGQKKVSPSPKEWLNCQIFMLSNLRN